MNKNLKKVLFAFIVVTLIIGIVLIAKVGKFEKLEGYMYSLAAEITGTATCSDATSCDATSSNATSSNATSSNATSSNAHPVQSPVQSSNPAIPSVAVPSHSSTTTQEPSPTPEKEEEKVPEKFDFYGSEITPAIVSSIVAGDSDVTITLDEIKTISKSIFDALKGSSRTLTIKSGDNEIIFKGKDIENPKSIDASITILSALDDEKIGKKTNDNGIVVEFADNGELPGEATIRIKVTNQIKSQLDVDKKLYIYFYNEEKEILEKINENVNYEKEYVEFTIDHNSKYVLTNQVIEEEENIVTQGSDNKKAKNEKENESSKEDVSFLESNKMYIVIIGAALIVIIIVATIIIVVNKKKANSKKENEPKEKENE